MSLMKRGGVYWSYFYLDGIRHQESTGTGSRRIALQIEAKLIEDANLKRFQVTSYQPDMPFGELAAHFLAKARVRPHHVGRLKMLLPYFSEIPIQQIDRGLVSKYRQARHREKTITEATVNRDVEVLRRILYWAVDEERFLQSNPLGRIRLERERKKRRPVLTIAQEAALLAKAPAHLRRILIIALDTGMRRGEILNQKWEDVDAERNLLFVSRSKTPEGEAREIPLTGRALSVLAELDHHRGAIFTFHKHPIQAIKTSWKTTLRKAGVSGIRFHDLRHTFATRLMEIGVSREVRKALLGHSSGSDVHDGYVHVELPLKRKAIATLERWHHKQMQSIGGTHDTAKTNGDEATGESRRAETLEEEDAGRSRARTD